MSQWVFDEEICRISFQEYLGPTIITSNSSPICIGEVKVSHNDIIPGSNFL